MTRLMLPLSGDLFDPPAEAIVDNVPICAAVHESISGTKRLAERERICPLSGAKQTRIAHGELFRLTETRPSSLTPVAVGAIMARRTGGGA
jgi:hypothetical protein